MNNFIQGIVDSTADRTDKDLTQRMLRGLHRWPLSYRIGYRLFCQRGKVEGDCYAGYILLTINFVALLIGVAMYVR